MNPPWTRAQWETKLSEAEQMEDCIMQMKAIALEGYTSEVARGREEEYMAWQQKLRQELGVPQTRTG